MDRKRHAEVVAETRRRVGIIVDNIFHADAEPFFDDDNEQAAAEAEVAKIANRVRWPRGYQSQP